MLSEQLLQLKANKDKVGVICTYFTKQFLERDFNLYQLPSTDFIEYIDVNNISIVVLDNDIYENDHLWFEKDLSGLLSYLKFRNIKVYILKNTTKKIPNTYLDYTVIEFTHEALTKENQLNSVKLPILINERKINSVNKVKSLDVVYMKKGDLLRSFAIQDFNAALKPERQEIVFENFSKKIIFDIIEKIKITKCLYIYDPTDFDPILLKYIEIISVLQNTVVLYSDSTLKSDIVINNDEITNISLMSIMHKDNHYRDKILLPLQRQVYLSNTFTKYKSILELLEMENEIETKVPVSVITSTNRKHNLKSYFKQLINQKDVDLQVVLITHGFEIDNKEIMKYHKDIEKLDLKVVYVPSEQPLGYCLNRAISEIKHFYVAKMDDDDFYFEHYLIDSWIAARYTDADLVGKYSTYTFFQGSNLTISKYKNTRRKYHPFVMGATFFAKSQLMKKYMFSYLPTGEDSDFLRRINEDNAVIYADQPYNFCIFRSQDLESHTWKISDIDFMKNSFIESYDNPKKLLSF